MTMELDKKKNRFGWSEFDLWLQFQRAVTEGWIAYMREFGRLYDIPAYRIAAIASRETNIQNIRGDYSQRKGEVTKRYHGFGVMQVDLNTDPDFARRWNAAVHKSDMARESFEKGVKILKSKYTYLANKKLTEPILTRYAIAAYNGGERRAYDAWIDNESPDSITTKKNYYSDVAAREVVFQKFFATLEL